MNTTKLITLNSRKAIGVGGLLLGLALITGFSAMKLRASDHRAINRLGRKHLKVSRQRKDFAVKTALCVVKSSDFVAYEDLQVRNMVRNHKLAKSISDAAWSQFTQWLQYLGKVYGKTVVSVAPQYTSQDCSNCGTTVKKALSVRTHVCGCGTVLDRDHNAALNILAKALKQAGIDLNTLGHREINAWGQTDLYSESGDIIEQADWLNQESSCRVCRGVSIQASELGFTMNLFVTR